MNLLKSMAIGIFGLTAIILGMIALILSIMGPLVLIVKSGIVFWVGIPLYILLAGSLLGIIIYAGEKVCNWFD